LNAGCGRHVTCLSDTVRITLSLDDSVLEQSEQSEQSQISSRYMKMDLAGLRAGN
jgi:hypothetical protein